METTSKTKTTRHPSLISVAILILGSMIAHESGATETTTRPANAVDQSSPVAVVESLFTAAKTRNFEPLASLCDPERKNDGDTDCICALASGYEPHKCRMNSHNRVSADEYVTYFKDGSVKGEARIQGDRSAVDFRFGPGGGRSETMNLVRRNGLWYLSSF